MSSWFYYNFIIILSYLSVRFLNYSTVNTQQTLETIANSQTEENSTAEVDEASEQIVEANVATTSVRKTSHRKAKKYSSTTKSSSLLFLYKYLYLYFF